MQGFWPFSELGILLADLSVTWITQRGKSVLNLPECPAESRRSWGLSPGSTSPPTAFHPCHPRRPRAASQPSPRHRLRLGDRSRSRQGVLLRASRSPDEKPVRLAVSKTCPAGPANRGAHPWRTTFEPCPPGDLNPHDRSHWNLNPARLPIPPGGQETTLGRARSEQSTHNGAGS